MFDDPDDVARDVTGSEQKFIWFRVRMHLILDGILLALGALSTAGRVALHQPDWFWAAVILALVAVHIAEEAFRFRRVRNGTFGSGMNDKDVWRQYVRFRDDLPGKWTNQDL